MTAFVAALTGALILLAGLVIDGGLALAARVRAINEAQEAARSGAQQIDLTVYRTTGRVVLDQRRASAAALAYLAATGDSGTVAVTGDRVAVTVRAVQRSQVLVVAGVGSFSVSGTAAAQAQRGVLP